jgi:hypothetical protein
MLKEMKRTSVKRIYIRQGLDHNNLDSIVRILIVEGPICKNQKTQGLLKENDLVEPWIFDPTAAVAWTTP